MGTQRQHLRAAAKRSGKAAVLARAALKGPRMPSDLAYLYAWACELYGRSGSGMGGLNPMTYPTLESWARLTGRQPNMLEIEALFALDTVMLDPEAM